MESTFRDAIDDDTRLIETMLWTPEGGVHRRERHLARLARSAARLGYVLPKANAVLDGVAAPSPRRLRLTLDRHGTLDLATTPHQPLAPDTIWTVQISSRTLQSDDPWLTVKSTRRALYDNTRAALPRGVDEVVFLNERSELCEGTITNIFADFGQGLVTPPVSCGLLPGILREELLAEGRVEERVISADDLRHAKAVFIGNALRGLIPARMV